MGQTTLLQSSTATPQSLASRVWQLPAGKVGTVLTALVFLIAVIGYFFAEAFTGHSPTESVGLPFEAFGLFGTDVLGRSVATRFLAGGLALVWYSVVATAIGVILGTIVGMISAYAGGILDWLIMRLNDV